MTVDVRYLAPGVMTTYRHLSSGKDVAVASYQEARNLLEAIYASGRFAWLFEGILLFRSPGTQATNRPLSGGKWCRTMTNDGNRRPGLNSQDGDRRSSARPVRHS